MVPQFINTRELISTLTFLAQLHLACNIQYIQNLAFIIQYTQNRAGFLLHRKNIGFSTVMMNLWNLNVPTCFENLLELNLKPELKWNSNSPLKRLRNRRFFVYLPNVVNSCCIALYKSQIWPIMEHCCQHFTVAAQSSISKFVRVQKYYAAYTTSRQQLLHRLNVSRFLLFYQILRRTTVLGFARQWKQEDDRYMSHRFNR